MICFIEEIIRQLRRADANAKFQEMNTGNKMAVLIVESVDQLLYSVVLVSHYFFRNFKNDRKSGIL